MIDTIKGIIYMVNMYKSIRDKANLLYAKGDFTQFTQDELAYIAQLSADKMCVENRRKRELIKAWTLELDECKELVESEGKG